MKTLLKFTITVDHEDRFTPVDVDIKLYAEDGEYVWRIGGPLGDECEGLPRPKSLAQAKADARLVYPRHSPFNPRSEWM